MIYTMICIFYIIPTLENVMIYFPGFKIRIAPHTAFGPVQLHADKIHLRGTIHLRDVVD